MPLLQLVVPPDRCLVEPLPLPLLLPHFLRSHTPNLPLILLSHPPLPPFHPFSAWPAAGIFGAPATSATSGASFGATPFFFGAASLFSSGPQLPGAGVFGQVPFGVDSMNHAATAAHCFGRVPAVFGAAAAQPSLPADLRLLGRSTRYDSSGKHVVSASLLKLAASYPSHPAAL